MGAVVSLCTVLKQSFRHKLCLLCNRGGCAWEDDTSAACLFCSSNTCTLLHNSALSHVVLLLFVVLCRAKGFGDVSEQPKQADNSKDKELTAEDRKWRLVAHNQQEWQVGRRALPAASRRAVIMLCARLAAAGCCHNCRACHSNLHWCLTMFLCHVL